MAQRQKKAFLRGIIEIERALIVKKETFVTIVIAVCKAAISTQEKKTFCQFETWNILYILESWNDNVSNVNSKFKAPCSFCSS